jgi:hypothetical protein
MASQPPGPAALELAQAEVEAIVQQVTESPRAQVVNWQVEPLTGGRETVSRIYRVRVQVQLPPSRSPIELPLVLKLVRMTPERRSPAHWNYWLREAEAYASGTLAQLPTGLGAPRCYGVKQQEELVWIWLEPLENAPDAQWTEGEIGTVCYELGRFNGAYLADAILPTGRWATRDWLRQYVAATAGYIEQLPQLQHHPLVGGSVTPQLLPELLRLVEEREAWLRLLESLPQVFCHQDIHRGNLFQTRSLAGERHLVAIDWSFTGCAALGQELASILFTNRRLPGIFNLATHRYLAGLRSMGWQGDETIVLWSSAITVALNYGVAMVGFFIDQLLDAQKQAALVDGFGQPIEQLPRRINPWVEFGLHYANVARSLVRAG